MLQKPKDRIMRMRELPEIVGISRASIYRRVADGTFPEPVKLGPNSVGWRLSVVEAWMAELHKAA